MAIFDEAMLITAESLSPELSGDCFSILGHAPGLFEVLLVREKCVQPAEQT